MRYRRKRLVVSLRQSGGDALIARNHQTRRKYRSAVGRSDERRTVGRDLARISRRLLPWAERLHVVADIRQGTIEFPPQAIVQSQVRSDLPAVLRERVQGGRPHIFDLRRALLVLVRQAKQVVGIEVVGIFWSIQAGAEIVVEPVDFEEERLVKTHAPNVSPKFERMVSFNLG
jgi:hypothetical protein